MKRRWCEKCGLRALVQAFTASDPKCYVRARSSVSRLQASGVMEIRRSFSIQSSFESHNCVARDSVGHIGAKNHVILKGSFEIVLTFVN